MQNWVENFTSKPATLERYRFSDIPVLLSDGLAGSDFRRGGSPAVGGVAEGLQQRSPMGWPAMDELPTAGSRRPVKSFRPLVTSGGSRSVRTGPEHQAGLPSTLTML